MSSTIDSAEFNSMFGEAMNRGGAHLDKVAEVTGLYIQEKLRENSFARRILPPQTVTQAELTRNEFDEGQVYIDDLEPDSIAMRVNMRGEPNKTYIQAERYSIRIETISSDKFVKTEQELRSYRMPLTKVIEQNTVKDIQEVNDEKFMEHVRAALVLATRSRHNDLQARGGVIGSTKANFQSVGEFAQYLFTRSTAGVTGGAGGTYNAPVTATPTDGFYSNIIMSDEATFTRRVITEGAKIMASRQLKAKVFLLHEFDWADSGSWTQDDAGLELLKEIVIGGYKYTTVSGYTFVTTVRDNAKILEPGQIYMFPAPEFLGRFLLLNNTQFYINKQGRYFTMEAWEECGIGFGNIKGIGLVLLAGRSVTLPNAWQDAAGVSGAGDLVGEFTLTNDKDAPL